MRLRMALPLAVAAIFGQPILSAQRASLPNPYLPVIGWAPLPAGRIWGQAAALDVDRSGHLWFSERCGSNMCTGSELAPILEFDRSGMLLKSFGQGMFAFPHGIHVDPAGNIWVTDAPAADVAHGRGHQVFKFSPDGALLMTLGKAGVADQRSDTFNRPTSVVVAQNGDIFVADGHGGDSNARIVKFSKDGKFLTAWGHHGAAPGEFDTPHALAFDSRGRLFVADRGNNRIQIFDQTGKFLVEWKQFGRPSGLFIDALDTLYVTDSQSTPELNPGMSQGIRIGSAKTGKVTAFIPNPAKNPDGNPPTIEGIVVDASGTIYVGETGMHPVSRKYVRKR